MPLAAGDAGIPGATEGLGGSLFLDQLETLHLVWSTTGRILHSSAPLSRAMDPTSWLKPKPAAAGNVNLGDVLISHNRLCILYVRGQQDSTSKVCFAVLSEQGWNEQVLWESGPCYPPIAELDKNGHLHVAWSDVPGRLWYGQANGEGLAIAEPLLVDPFGRQPSIIVSRGSALVAYEDEYPHIHLARIRDGQVLQTESLTMRHEWFTQDLVHSPQWSIDRFRVPWLFFVDNTRRSLFWARWLGEELSSFTNGPRLFYRPPHFDWNLLPIGRLSVEKHCRSGAPDIGMLLTLEPPLAGNEYRAWEVPSHPAGPGRKVLFLDALEIQARSGLEIKVEEARRCSENPLLGLGLPGDFDCDRVFNHGAVLKDGNKWRMWYGAIRVPEGNAVPWWDTIRCGYAESPDGIVWGKIKLGLVPWNHSKENNLVPELRHSPLMIRDDGDPDPQRRYKSLYVWNSGELGEMARSGKYGLSYDPRDESFPAILFTSPDGIHLTPHPARIVFPEGCAKPFSIIPQSFFYDAGAPDARRRWKAYGFMSLNLRRRGSAFIYSPDGITWTVYPEVPVLDPAVRGTPAVSGGPLSQIHDTVVFPYEGYYLALYQNQYDAENLDVELAVSRDAETFVHVNPGQKVIPLGAAEAWDSDYICQTMPVILEDEIRIYYGGGKYYEPKDDGERRRLGPKPLRFLPGLASLRKDGFTSLTLRTGYTAGSFTTLPFKLPSPAALHVNARCDSNATIRVALLDAESDRPIPGFDLEDCLPLSVDSFCHEVQWQPQRSLPAGADLRLRFSFAADGHTPKLFSYWFAE